MHTMNDQKRILRYLIGDCLSSALAWLAFNVFRFYTFRHTIRFSGLDEFLTTEKALWMSVLIPVFWGVMYYFSGYYALPRRKTVLGDILNTTCCTVVGVLLLFFLIVINDYPEYPSLYYRIIVGFVGLHLGITLLVRLAQTIPLLLRQAKGKDNVPVLIIGTGERARQIRSAFNAFHSNFYYRLEGFVRVGPWKEGVPESEVVSSLEALGDWLKTGRVEELIVALDEGHPEKTRAILEALYPLRLPVKAYVSRQDMLAGKVSLFSLFGIPLVPLTPLPMPVWQTNVKRFLDRLIALIFLLLCSPVYAYLAMRVRLDSPGPVFYSQKRVGKSGRLFRMYKFRTMYAESEPDGPMLSAVGDPRVTPYGRFMRKYRLDELPQFWNVLKGDMALVGPRPERAHFVRQIVARAPQYYLVQQVLPGITSWGMVKYGYANSVDKMIRRLEYDLIYLENQSLLLDLKILLSTVKPLLWGKGQ
jgi:exopolysaccharide biosynthesis polyprenyl glycosylphosphotransferase